MYSIRKLILLLIFTPLVAVAQTVIKGDVYDAETKKPVAGAVITVLDQNSETIAFEIASEKGKFTVSTDISGKSILLVCRMLGYREEQLTIENKSQNIVFFLEQTGIELKEVTVKSRPIIIREDTLIYSVSTFKSASDRSIGDLLKKLPGIEVDNSGGIKYKGERINKFYIEGIDLLESKYGIATNNVPVDAVRNVEVIENHQPIKSIKGMIYSAQAAINLKLKDEKMTRPVGGVHLGGGYSDEVNWLLEVFALLTAKKNQSIVMYKTNNTGKNISSELNDQIFSLRDSQGQALGVEKTILLPSIIDNPPIEEQRYMFNQSHVASLNNLWKTGKDSQLRINLNYFNDFISQNKTVESVYLLPDSSLTVIESGGLTKRQILLDGALTYTDNAPKHYLNNAFKWKIKNEKTLSRNSTNNIDVNQDFSIPHINIQDKLDYLKRWDDNILNIGTLLVFSHQPEKLIVDKDGLREIQDIRLTNFYSKTESYYSWLWSRSGIRLDGIIEASVNNISSDLAGTVFTDSLKTKFQSRMLKVELKPIYSYRITSKTNLKISFPITNQIIFKEDKIYDNTSSKNYLFVNTATSLTHKFNNYLSSSISYKYSRNIGDYIDFIDAYLMKNYRSYYKYSGNISLTENQSLSLSIDYRDPMSVLFSNGMVAYIPMERNKMIAHRFVGIQSIASDVAMINKSNMWIAAGYIGKYFSRIKTNVSLSANYNHNQTSYLQQDVFFPLSMSSLSLILKGNTKFSNRINFEYKMNFMYGRSEIEISNISNVSHLKQFGQQIKTYISAYKKLDLILQLEQSYNELSENTSVNMYFANVGLIYKMKHTDLELNCTNIFNQKEYSYSIFSELNTYSYYYNIRPMSIMLTTSFKF